MPNSKARGNGEGTIFKRNLRGKDIWVAEYSLKNSRGEAKRKTLYAPTRKEVKAKLHDLITDLNIDKYVDKSSVTLHHIAEQFIEDSYKLNRLSPNSYIRKKATLTKIYNHYISNVELQRINDEDIKDFFAYLTNSSQSIIDKAYGLLNNSFKRAIIKNIITVNPLDNTLELSKPKSKKQTKKVKGFTVLEQEKFIKAVFGEFEKLQHNQQIEYKYQFLISMFTGLRMGEINALDKDKDINLASGEITVRRTLTRDINDKTIIGEVAKTVNGIRTIHLDEHVKILINEYINTFWEENAENLLFWDKRKSGLFSTGQVNLVFKRLCKKHDIGAGYKVNQHMLRHTFATRCIEAGMPANVLAKIMGHSDFKTTLEIYCDVFAEYERKHTDRTQKYLEDRGILRHIKLTVQ